MVGKFITFEGPEGSGKSTHIQLLAEFLKKRGIEVVCSREPGGTDLAEDIRNLIQSVREDAPVPATEVLLFLASRAQHVQKKIRPALERGAWVLCDRFEDSTFAYQGAGRGFPLEKLRTLNNFATQGLVPDLVLILDIPRSAGKKRLAERQIATHTEADRIEREAEAFHERLRQQFLMLADQDPQRYEVVSTDHPRDEVSEKIQRIITERFLEEFHAGS